MKGIIPILFLITLSLSSCYEEGVDIEYSVYEKEAYEIMTQYLNLPESPLIYRDEFPSFFEDRGVDLHDRNLATLGRVLFYDTNLSKDRSISCASCHKQEIAFSDDKALSNGVLGRETDRNSIALGSVFSFKQQYSIDRTPFFWDNRASSVQMQSRQTFNNPDEMGIELSEVMERVKEEPYYVPLFKAAFGREVKHTNDILNAIAEFINSMGSFDSKYDRALEKVFVENGSFSSFSNKDLPGLTTEENIGRQLFNRNCGSCHGNVESRNKNPKREGNNGLYATYEDEGIGGFTQRESDLGKFKVPSLRNVALTAPYMHDGSLATLEDVINHYSSGIQSHPNLSFSLKENGKAKQFNFSEAEKTALIAFLNTLTDEIFITAEKYSDPFK